MLKIDKLGIFMAALLVISLTASAVSAMKVPWQ